jgi:hypothetical protein
MELSLNEIIYAITVIYPRKDQPKKSGYALHTLTVERIEGEYTYFCEHPPSKCRLHSYDKIQILTKSITQICDLQFYEGTGWYTVAQFNRIYTDKFRAEYDLERYNYIYHIDQYMDEVYFKNREKYPEPHELWLSLDHSTLQEIYLSFSNQNETSWGNVNIDWVMDTF